MSRRVVWNLVLSTLPTLLSTTVADAEVIRGRVESQGRAVEHARIAAVEAGRGVFSDARGRFELECEMPCLLLVTHPRFTERALELTAPSADLLVELVAKQKYFDEMVVTASRGAGDAFAPESVTSTVIHAGESVAGPSTLLEVVEGVAGVAENGQGGIFQVFSIRGVSRQRVMTLVDGMQIVSERRAGVSTSWIDPLLMDGVEILRGPSSTYYGSGALGGVVQVFPRRYQGWRVEAGGTSFGDETYQVVGWGDERWSLGFAHRRRGNDTAPDGTALNERFEQYSLTFSHVWRAGEKTWEVLAIPTLGVDIGKSNNTFPDSRITDYPQETHLLLRAGVSSERGWRFYAWAHPNNLRTATLRVGESFNLVRNEALDWGANFQREVTLRGSLAGRFGVDYFGRRGVRATEVEESLTSPDVFFSETLDGERDDVALYGTLRWNWGSATLQAGSRLTWHQQKNTGFATTDDTALTGFLGLVQPLGAGFELTANVGTGLRFASLSERYFSGTTGRGTIEGSPDLDPEESLSTDLGLRWFGERVFVSGSIFRQDIDDYIERVDVTDDLQRFRNLTAGEITGFELEGFVKLDERFRLHWSGHLLDGEDDATGGALADVPSDRVQLGLDFEEGPWTAKVLVQRRARKDDPGSGEVPIPAADLLSAAIEFELRDGLNVSLRGRNLLDETYFSSADRRAPVAIGRSLGVGLSWEP